NFSGFLSADTDRAAPRPRAVPLTRTWGGPNMRAAWWAIGLCVVASGCGLVGRATHNLTYETRCCLDRAHEAKRNRRWVAEAWAHGCADGGPRSGDYAQGFADGFLDYLEAGGSGEPPVLPPRRYWGSAYQTPVGRQLVDEWFAGFRHGAAVARDAGYRDLVTLPTSFGRPTTAALAPPEPDLLPPAAAQSQ